MILTAFRRHIWKKHAVEVLKTTIEVTPFLMEITYYHTQEGSMAFSIYQSLKLRMLPFSTKTNLATVLINTLVVFFHSFRLHATCLLTAQTE